MPSGWVTAPLEDWLQPVHSTDPGLEPEQTITYFDISSIDNETGKAIAPKVVAGAEAPSRARQVALPDDVLFSTVRPGLRAIAMVPAAERPFASTGFCVLRACEGVNATLLYHLVRSDFFVQQVLPFQRGVSYPAVRDADILGIEVSLPPAAEQTRIVAKLEALLESLDAGVAELKAAQQKQARYRQSLLKAAVEGALTFDWRASNPPAETSVQLLARILTECRARWEDKQRAKFAAQGKTPPKGWQAKYPEPAPPDTTGLPQLPQGWVWATLSQVGWLDRGRSKHRPRNASHLYGGPYPFVQTGDIRHSDTFLRRAEATYSEDGLAQSRLWPAGTMCITIAANIGKTAILGMSACFPDSVVGFLPVSEDVSVRYVEYFMRTAQQSLEELAPATAQKNINIEILERVVFPVPPPTEQKQLVSILDGLLASAADQERAIETALKQSTAQRQNLLRAAFAGELVPQDPADEPASSLLARIRAERAAQGAAKKPRGRKAKGAA